MSSDSIQENWDIFKHMPFLIILCIPQQNI